jgi:deoxyribose-phosphate aldolase
MMRNELTPLLNEVIEALSADGRRAREFRCRCHSVLRDCCPDRLRSVLGGPTLIGVDASGGATSAIASMFDHTLLRPDATRTAIEGLCREAAQFEFATVCVNPAWVALSVRLLAGTGVGVCSVVGFPLGAATVDVKAYEAGRAMVDGAREIDMVMNIGALKSGGLESIEREIDTVARSCRACGALIKVIIETAMLTDQEKADASTIARRAGADYVKTSTGFGPGGATVADVALIRRVVGPEMGIKAAGGIRTLEQFKAMVGAGATRIGSSAAVEIVREARAKCEGMK